jgi:hypothetical protein
MVIINETVIGGPLITSGTGSVASNPQRVLSAGTFMNACSVFGTLRAATN